MFLAARRRRTLLCGPRRTASAAAVAAVVLAAGPAAAHARTLTVDDNRAQCPAASYTTIQAAVDVSMTGDVINICAGTYREQVLIAGGCAGSSDCTVTRSHVTLNSRPRRAAHIVPPAAFRGGRSWSLMTIAAPATTVRGFTFSGGLPAEPGGRCTNGEGGSAITVGEALVSLFDNRIQDLTIAARCQSAFFPLAGVVIGDSTGAFGGAGRALVDGNEIVNVDGVALGVSQGSVNALRNVLRNTGRRGMGIYFDERATGVARLNDVSGFDAGIQVQNAFSDLVRLLANSVHDNHAGILSIADNGAFVHVLGNTVSGNDTGISMGFGNPSSGLTVVGEIGANLVLDSAVNGIELGDALFRVHDNTVLRSGHLDCLDFVLSVIGPDPSFSSWVNNKGARDDPSFICKP